MTDRGESQEAIAAQKGITEYEILALANGLPFRCGSERDLRTALQQVIGERDRYRAALEEINDPILFMQTRASAAGDEIDWPMATALARSVPFLRSIAASALAGIGEKE